jgi:hypothetical protein
MSPFSLSSGAGSKLQENQAARECETEHNEAVGKEGGKKKNDERSWAQKENTTINKKKDKGIGRRRQENKIINIDSFQTYPPNGQT